MIPGILFLIIADGNNVTREVIEIRGLRVIDIQFGNEFIAIQTTGTL